MILKKDLKTATPDSIPPQMEFAETLLVAHGYSVIKIRKDSWYIVKNEHGTYGEFLRLYFRSVCGHIDTNGV
jgi:hypothetical protein